jgi:hypothetical protein
MYNKIINPVTNRKVNISSKLGISIIKNYVAYGGEILCKQLGECSIDNFCINNKCTEISTDKLKSGRLKDIYLPDNSSLVYSKISTNKYDEVPINILLEEHIIKEYMHLIFEELYEQLPLKYKYIVPFTPKINSLWINPVPDNIIINEHTMYTYNYKYTEKNIYNLGYKHIILVDETDIAKKYTTKLIKSKTKEEHSKITKNMNDELIKFFLNNANTSLTDLRKIKISLYLANKIMNLIGIKHIDIHSENVFYHNKTKRIGFIDWGSFVVRSDDKWSEEERYSEKFMGILMSNNVSYKSDPIIAKIETLIINIFDDINSKFPLKNYRETGYDSIKNRIIIPENYDIFLSNNPVYDIQEIKNQIVKLVKSGNYSAAENLENILIEFNKVYPKFKIFKKSDNKCNCIEECNHRNTCDWITGFCKNTKKCNVNPLTCSGEKYDPCI